MISDGLRVVGWYHSHPSSEATPSVNDVTQQLLYQETVSTNEGEEPCVGFIIGKTWTHTHTHTSWRLSIMQCSQACTLGPNKTVLIIEVH